MKKIKKIILCILSLFLVLCLYQWYIQSKDTYRFKSVTYTQKTLPKEFNGFTIGYLSDLNLSTKEDVFIKDFSKEKLLKNLVKKMLILFFLVEIFIVILHLK